MDFQPIFMAGHSLQDWDKSHWEGKVRPSVVPNEKPSCSVCGFIAETNRSLIHADEVWSFPEPPKVVLIDVRPLCVYCHEAKDYGEFVSRIKLGEAGAGAETIAEHYCKVNGCTRDEFNADLEAALAAKRELEDLYGCNCDVQIDYGSWSRPADRPRLSEVLRRKLKSLFDAQDGPVIVGETRFSDYRSAVRQLQALPLDRRAPVIDELIKALESVWDEDEVMAECDEGIQWK